MAARDVPLDERAAARVATLRAACTLSIARVLGSLRGRPEGVLWSVAMEPGGRHAAVLVIGAVERWDLDSLTCVGRWPLARGLLPNAVSCVGAAPAGLRFVADGERRSGLAMAAPLPVEQADGSMSMSFHDPPTPAILRMHGDEIDVLVRVSDGAPLCDIPRGQRCWCDPAGRWVVVRRSTAALEVLEVRAGKRTRSAVSLAVAADDDARVAVDDRGRFAVVTGASARISAWNEWPAARTFPVPAHAWSDLELCDEGRILVLCGPGRVVRLDTATGQTSEVRLEPVGREEFAIDVAAGRVLHADSAGLRVIDGPAAVTRTHPSDVTLVTAATATANLLVTSAADGSLRVVDRVTGEQRAQLRCPTREPHSVAVTADGRELVALGAVDGLLRWSLASGALLARIQLPAASDRAPPHLWIAPDGRAVAFTSCTRPHHQPTAYFVELPGGRVRRATRVGRTFHWGGELCLGFTADGALRGAILSRYGDRLQLWRRPPGARRPEPAGESRSDWRALLATGTDGRLQWRECVAEYAVTVAIAAPDVAADPIARWEVGGRVSGCCAGRKLAAVVVDDELMILHEDGRKLAAELPDGCAPLTFAPDDRTLWIRDESGLLLELAVPDAFVAGLSRA